MEASAPIIVGLLVGSLVLTCMLSLCVAKIFGKKKNEKDLESDESDLDSPEGARKARNTSRISPNTVYKPTVLATALPSRQQFVNFPRNATGYVVPNDSSSTNTSGSSGSPISSISRAHIVPTSGSQPQRACYNRETIPAVPATRQQTFAPPALSRKKPLYKSVPHRGALVPQEIATSRSGFQNYGYSFG